MDTQPSAQDQSATILDLQKKLAAKQLEQAAFKSLSEELTNILDLGEAIDAVNKYLWEMLDYSVAAYLVFNFAEDRFESRFYLKESVSQTVVESIKKRLADYIVDNADRAVVGSIASAQTLQPILFGVPIDDAKSSSPSASFTVPLNIGGKLVGALHISSIEPNQYSQDTQDLISMMVSIASVSVARIQSLIQSLHSRTESLIQNLSNGVIMFDKDMRVTLANTAASSFTGLPKEGYDLAELSKLFVEVNINELVRQALEQRKVVRVDRAALARFYYEISVIPILDQRNNVLGGAIVLHDITHIVEVDKAKTEFVSLASHQLRTPLSTIKWYSEMLLAGDVGEVTAEQREYLDEVYNGNQRMIDLVNALLNVSRLELGTFAVEPEDINICTLLDDVSKELKPKLIEKHLQYSATCAADIPTIRADPRLTRIVLQNIVGNAVKYTPENGSVTTTIEKRDPDIVITVKDSGFGIPKHQHSSIFSKLFRADNVKQKETEGTGLGLYIVKSIVDQSNGKIWFESDEDKGTTFFITLPLSGMKKKEGTRRLNEKKGKS